MTESDTRNFGNEQEITQELFKQRFSFIDPFLRKMLQEGVAEIVTQQEQVAFYLRDLDCSNAFKRYIWGLGRNAALEKIKDVNKLLKIGESVLVENLEREYPEYIYDFVPFQRRAYLDSTIGTSGRVLVRVKRPLNFSSF